MRTILVLMMTALAGCATAAPTPGPGSAASEPAASESTPADGIDLTGGPQRPLTPAPAAVQQPKPEAASDPPSTEAADSVEVVGVYEQLSVAQRVDAPPHYVGRAIIRQKDGRRVMLETHDRGVRSADEIALFEGKRVKVKATHAADRCLGWGSGTAATIVGPCVRGIVDISRASP